MWVEPPPDRMGKHTVEDPELVKTFESDSKGRVTLGTDYANKEIEIIVEEVR